MSTSCIDKINDFLNYHDVLCSDEFKFLKVGFQDIIKNYSFFHFYQNAKLTDNDFQQISQNIKESNAIIINSNSKLNEVVKQNYLVIGFEKTLILLEQSSDSKDFLQKIFSYNLKVPVCYLSNTKTLIHEIVEIQNPELESDSNFEEEIIDFNKILQHINPKNDIFPFVISCISGYLIKKSYAKLKGQRIKNFIYDMMNGSTSRTINENEYIEIRDIGSGSFSTCKLAYHLSTGELFVIKKHDNNIQNANLQSREKKNYEKICHPLIPKYFGTIQKKNYIVIEFISGQTLSDAMITKDDAFHIIFELMMLIYYFHTERMLLRDIKPDNIMINSNKTVVFIDFDRLIDNDEDQDRTLDINMRFSAPEVISKGTYSFESDIYSFGKLIEYIQDKAELQSDKYSIIDKIIQMCTNEDVKQRNSITKIIDEFITSFQTKIQIEDSFSKCNEHFMFFQNVVKLRKLNQNDQQAQYVLGIIYYKGLYLTRNIDKAIHYLTLSAAQNYSQAQLFLGFIYFDGKYVKPDIDSAIHYFTLASNQNNSTAQFNLGVIYQEGIYVKRDIDKAIHFYTLAADSNYRNAQVNLAVIYNEGKYVNQDIDKAIHYYTLAADQNDTQAQYNLGFFYLDDRFGKYDIKKAIHYFSLAADKNRPDAQYNLGLIYDMGLNGTRDIDKAIKYYTLSANQDFPLAQFKLGTIYYEEKYITGNLDKTIYYFTLAANQNHPDAEYNLGIIYYNGEGVTRDNNKAIHYFTLAANHNQINAQFKLGIIYSVGKYTSININKAIYYFTLAANNNHPQAQFNLGFIFSNKGFDIYDINKTIYYYSLAANHNHLDAQVSLGMIYFEGKDVARDIEKAIHYFILAAKQNHPGAQLNLGLIYLDINYISRDVEKAIHYITLAAEQNLPQAQYNLGVQYYTNKFVRQDINKAIHYLSLAAKQDIPQANYNLGVIYDEGKYVKRDVNKAIYYYTIAANKNIIDAQINLGLIYYPDKDEKGDIKNTISFLEKAAKQKSPHAQFYLSVIYYEGKYVIRDISKAIYYLKLAADQNFVNAQFNLGLIYIKGRYVTRDINKAIHFLTLAANQNHAKAQFTLALIYSEEQFHIVNIVKAIHYYTLAAEQNLHQAQNNLGLMYEEGLFVPLDINKAIHYFTLAANQNDEKAQINLGLLYYSTASCLQDIKKGIYYIMLSSKNNNIIGHFVHGFLLHEGKFVKRNIQEAINLYKEASSFNLPDAKNNLGIIYKHGCEGIEKKIGKAIVYFEEAIQQKNDILSMYNLAHINIYDETINKDLDKSIELLLKSYKFIHSKKLLSLVLIKKYGFDIPTIKKEVDTLEKDATASVSAEICNIISDIQSLGEKYYETLFESYRNRDFVYNIYFQPVPSPDLTKTNEHVIPSQYPNAKNITSVFYEGFGTDLNDID